MATSTLLQKLDPVADGFGASTSNRRQVESFMVTLTNPAPPVVPPAPPVFVDISLAAGTWVALDTSKTGADRALFVSAAATAANGNPLVCGVALETVTASLEGGASISVPVKVVVAGYAEGANVDNAVVAAGTALVVDATGVGIANALAATDTAPACGVSLEAAALGKADVWVLKQF